MAKQAELERGTLSFTIESRILRELGERLVKQPEVAVIELIKNAYDADATVCNINYEPGEAIIIADNGGGMTLKRFATSWMRIGTSSKEGVNVSAKFGRLITGEKGIGRFAVRFLGRKLQLESISFDPDFNRRTKLIADFDWPRFDQHEDLGKVSVPYRLEEAQEDAQSGTTLTIHQLREEAQRLDLRHVRTGSLSILTPLRSLLREHSEREGSRGRQIDPGFSLKIGPEENDDESDVALEILNHFVFRAQLEVHGKKLRLRVYRRGKEEPYFQVDDTIENHVGEVYSDLRWFPRRGGTFRGLSVDGRVAQRWVIENGGVAVFDRSFRVQPYGSPSDDWLQLQADVARRRREPRSPLALKHFPMAAQVKSSTAENWMLRLPQSAQLVGFVQVDARHSQTFSRGQTGLVASADREGFVENEAFNELRLMVRGAVEAMAYGDRRTQQEQEKAKLREMLASIRRETRSAIAEVEANPLITAAQKSRIVSALAETQALATRHQEATYEREQQLEVMSLLGVVAGFMTHEFGSALRELETTHKELLVISKQHPKLSGAAASFATHIKNLREFVTYSSGYIQGSKARPGKAVSRETTSCPSEAHLRTLCRRSKH
ncbi:ATP-binding protein [Bradyrhizobium sp. LMTR 3]|uniref:ATP-binding protein n=1 Tax=Bradyrhizobium sp. LMTR 3 TaxID=189873 RepID=UPI000810D822|nr:ATP-binding protein [Bradyrhizobium sp. LMTR 3]